MVIDWLVLWGVTKATGALVRPVLEDFAKDLAKDSAKGVVKPYFGKLFEPVKKEAHEKAIGKALKELVQLIDDEICNTGVPSHQTEAWACDVKQFIRATATQKAISQAFDSSTSIVDRLTLEQGWPSEVTARLPDDFDWEIVAKTFSKRLKNLRAQDEDLREIYTAQAQGETAENTRQMLGITPGFDLVAYRRALLQQYQKLQLHSLDPYSGRIAKLHSVFVEQNVRESQEYAPQLLTLPKEVRRRFLEEGGADVRDVADLESREEHAEERMRAFHSQASRPVFEVAGDPSKQRLVILGDPGSGKSSLLRYLALEWAEERTGGVLVHPKLVLLIELRDYAHWTCHGAKSFLLYWHEGPVFHRINQLALDEYLKSAADVELLLDGLDEIFDEDQRKWVLNDLQRFADEYSKVRIILTSRVIGYEKSQQRLTELGFRHFILQDLEDDQIKTFLERWHQETFTNDRDRQRKLALVEEAIRKTRAIRELAGNPLLLTLMAILNRQQELPRDRARLYERAAQLLMLDWKTELLEERFPQMKQVGIGFDDKAAMLRAVALHMQTAVSGARGNIITRRDLERILLEYLTGTLLVERPRGLADALVEQLRGQNFILCDVGNNHYAFVHRTFLEYFCAEAFVQQFEASLDLAYLRDQVFGPHWQDEGWHETLCLIAGIVGKKSPDHVKQIVEFLLKETDPSFQFHNLFLAGRCCKEMRNPRILGAVSDDVRMALEGLLRFDYPYFYEAWEDEAERRDSLQAKTVEALVSGQLLDQPLTWLKEHAANDDSWTVRSAAAQEVARGWKDSTDTLPWLKHRATNDDNVDVRSAAVRELARGWKDDPDTVPWLKDRAANDDNWEVRRAVVQELARGWKDHSDTMRWLNDLVANDAEGAVRSAAVHELARGWKDDPDTLRLLKDCATKDDNWEVRQAAVEELARGWKDGPETERLLRDLAANDATGDVRLVAAQELARGWKNDPATKQLLKTLIADDHSWAVRRGAVQELARGWKDSADTLTWLKERVIQVDEWWEVQQSAFLELVHGWKDAPDTLPYVKHVATNDDDWGLRYIAVLELGRNWNSHPDVRRLLRDRATIDETSIVRNAAIHQLARRWKDDPDTLALLKNRAANDEYSEVRQAAVQELARGWKNDPDTVPLLKDRVANDPSAYVRRTAMHELRHGWNNDPDTLSLLKERAVNDEDRDVRRAAVNELAHGWKDDPDTIAWRTDMAPAE
jgi:hypothetical protein